MYVCLYMCSMTAWYPPYRQQREESSQHQDAVDKMAGRLKETVSTCSWVYVYTHHHTYVYTTLVRTYIRTYIYYLMHAYACMHV